MITDEASARAYCLQHVGEAGMSKLEQFVDLLRQENERQNLVAKATLGEVWRRHVADSLQLIDHVPRETGTWLDLGSGGGFPGLVVAIAYPETQMALVEPRKLRVDWLRRIAREFDLRNVEVVETQIEHTGTRPAAVISARAFAPLAKLLKLSARFSTPDTSWVLPKGRSAGQDLQEQSPAVQSMFHVEQSLTDPQAGILVGRGVPRLR